MFHDIKEIKTVASRSLAIGGSSAVDGVEAFRLLCLESAVLSMRLLDNTQRLWLGAATNKDAKDVSRAMAAFLNATYRDVSRNGDAVLAIWRGFVRDAVSPSDSF
jgi:hypothetical protein